MRIEQHIAWAWAQEIRSECVQAVITELQAMRDEMLSGDSGLKNVWEEVCAQVQREHSLDWGAYEDLVWSAAESEIRKLSRDQQLSIWIQTEDGWNWVDDHFSDADGESTAPLDIAAIVKLMTDDVISKAADYDSKSLYRYLWDEEDEDEEEEGDSEGAT